MDYTKTKLFQGITQQEFQDMCVCFHARMGQHHAGDIITEEQVQGAVGILESGQAELIRIDMAGNRTILEYLQAGSIFGEMMEVSTAGDSVFVECRQDCRVMYINYDPLTKRCENDCVPHGIVVENMLRLMTEKALSLSRRVEVLSSRTIRGKLLCYFAQLSAQEGKSTFELSFSLSALADYISADRSAMMRELKKMREEGLVTITGRQVTLTQ